MDISSSVIVEIWETFSDYISTNKKDECARIIIEIFNDQHVDPDWFDLIRGADPYLDSALELLFEEDDISSDSDEEYEE